MAKKGYNYPIKKKIPLILLLNLFGSFIVSQFFPFVNRFCEFYKITFRKGAAKTFWGKRSFAAFTSTQGSRLVDIFC